MFRTGEIVCHAGVWLAVVTSVAIVGMAACQRGRTADDRLERLQAALPDSIGGWVCEDEDAIYDTESIYSYIDGHAEVYLAYGMRRCLARSYRGPAGESGITVDVFEMPTPADAFGVFTQDRDGDPVEMGADGLFRFGWLSFWQGSFFVSVYAEEDTEASRAAVLELGSAVAAAVPAGGGPPTIVRELPSEGLDPRSVRYLHDHQILNSHVWLTDDDVFHLTADTPAALGRYRLGDDAAYLLVVEYPDERRLEAARESFAEAFWGDSSEAGPARHADDGWFAIAVRGRRLVVALVADSPEIAAALLAEAAEGRTHDG